MRRLWISLMRACGNGHDFPCIYLQIYLNYI